MSNVFSKRCQDPQLRGQYVLSPQVRNRILQVLSRFVQDYYRGFLVEIQDLLVCEYGGMRQPYYEAARMSNEPAEEHFFKCCDAEAFDFLELAFRTRSYQGQNQGVEAINEILRECRMKYELTPWSEQVSRKGWRKQAERTVRYPIIVLKDTEFIYAEVVRPCLDLLVDDAYKVAAGELQDALEAHRRGDWQHALTACGSALESVLKTICSLKNWPYKPDGDTCGALLKVCQDHGLYPNFYTQILLGVATIRNKLSSAHGRGPEITYQPDRMHVEHCIALTATHITFLIKLATLKAGG